MSNKVVEATYNINNAQELLTKLQCSCGARIFAKTMRALKTRSTVAVHWKLTMTNLEVNKELNIDYSTVIQYLMQIGKLKKLSKWVLCELTKNQKKLLI